MWLYSGHPLLCAYAGCRERAAWVSPVRVIYGTCDRHREAAHTVPTRLLGEWSAWPGSLAAMFKREREVVPMKKASAA